MKKITRDIITVVRTVFLTEDYEDFDSFVEGDVYRSMRVTRGSVSTVSYDTIQ